jgi:AcrR family transcriptional regulator
MAQTEPTEGADRPIWRPSFSRRPPPSTPDEGLRDRKKRELRQRISDTATSMFLERGFDSVTVSEVAAACDVSEKTVYNYFPTKESLIFDREEDQARLLREALAERDGAVAIVDAVLEVLESDVRSLYDAWVTAGKTNEGLTAIRRFGALIETTPALSAALHGMTERLTQVAAAALAERAGVDPDDPEPQMAATIVMGLWRTQFHAMRRYADGVLTVEGTRDAVIDEIRRAAGVAAGGLSSFNSAVRSASTKEQLREAAEAADAARKQVVAAMKQAKAAWRQVMAEVAAAHHHQAEEAFHGGRRPDPRELRQRQQELRNEIRMYQQELRRQQAEMRQQAADMRQAARGGRRGGGRR